MFLSALHFSCTSDGDRKADAEVVHYTMGQEEERGLMGGPGSQFMLTMHMCFIPQGGEPEIADSFAPLACFNPQAKV
ncbi:hypothetical protein PBY51_011541 [Eleginops maclovinus]|uniref:Uncharacterized protein n=1 Tax=Eleginops maclovinus TaxID=56733 RepID=A0AAN7XVG5_ELEMC|nr:hypothetical protein PBY51_011541 [Eleginops maclovinus]